MIFAMTNEWSFQQVTNDLTTKQLLQRIISGIWNELLVMRDLKQVIRNAQKVTTQYTTERRNNTDLNSSEML